MANKTISQIEETLNDFQKELQEFKTLIEYLNGAKDTVEIAVGTNKIAVSELVNRGEQLKHIFVGYEKLIEKSTNLSQKIDEINFPERLTQIEKSIESALSQFEGAHGSAINELKSASDILAKAEISTHLDNLRDLTERNIANNTQIVDRIEHLNLQKQIKEFEIQLSKQVTSLISELKSDTTDAISDLSENAKSMRTDFTNGLSKIHTEISTTLETYAVNTNRQSDEQRERLSIELANIKTTIDSTLSNNGSLLSGFKETIDSLANEIQQLKKSTGIQVMIIAICIAIIAVFSIFTFFIRS